MAEVRSQLGIALSSLDAAYYRGDETLARLVESGTYEEFLSYFDYKLRTQPENEAGAEFIYHAAAVVGQLLGPASGKGDAKPLSRGLYEGTSKTYMLHRTLPTGDLFSSPAVLNDRQVKAYANLKDADVVSIDPSLVRIAPEDTAPTRLGDVVPRVKPFPIQLEVRPAHTDMLYYDAFASFAPTHDSAGATNSYYKSARARTNRQALRRYDTLRQVPAPDTAPADAVTELGRNRDRIALLIHRRWDRLRKTKAPPTDAENAVAATLAASFAGLISRADNYSAEVPAAPRLERLANSLIISSATEQTYAGLSENGNDRAVLDSALQAREETAVGSEDDSEEE